MLDRLSSSILKLSVFAVVATLFLLGSARTANAYPWMIRHEYSGCIPCHADPSGGGLLTVYGRAQGEILLRTQYGKAVDDPGKTGDFLFGLFNLPDPVLLGGDFREAALYVKPQGAPATTDLFLMQGDVTGQVKVSRVRANASIGFAQEGAFGAAITKGSKNNLVSRVHWLGVDLGEDDQFLIRAGRMNLPFGLRSVEHVAWTRMYTRTDSNDEQQDGAAFAFNVKGWRGEVMAIAGNFQESPDAYRERGYSGYLEWDPHPKFTLGASSLITHANIGVDPNGVPLTGDLVRQAHGLFARFSPVKSLVLMAENDFLYDSQPASFQSGAINSPGIVDQLEADFEPIQGVHVAAIGEILDKKSDLPIPGSTVPWLRAWGVVNWFFAPHADVRVDAIYESDAQGGERIGIATLLAQLHVYL
jgi:hypothetical protein